MRILGIDPGIATVGFGVVDSTKNKQTLVRCGVIKTPAGTSLSSRLNQIYDDLNELITAFSPDSIISSSISSKRTCNYINTATNIKVNLWLFLAFTHLF